MLQILDETHHRPVRIAVRAKLHLSGETKSLSGFWRSEGGSLYLYDGGRFICIAVHHATFCGWFGRCAVKDVQTVGSVYSGLQAFRCGGTGALLTWAPITISLENDVVTKFFPAHIPSHLLVYGHVERYFRVPLDDDGRR